MENNKNPTLFTYEVRVDVVVVRRGHAHRVVHEVLEAEVEVGDRDAPVAHYGPQRTLSAVPSALLVGARVVRCGSEVWCGRVVRCARVVQWGRRGGDRQVWVENGDKRCEQVRHALRVAARRVLGPRSVRQQELPAYVNERSTQRGTKKIEMRVEHVKYEL